MTQKPLLWVEVGAYTVRKSLVLAVLCTHHAYARHPATLRSFAHRMRMRTLFYPQQWQWPLQLCHVGLY